jgi:hypothetical protein
VGDTIHQMKFNYGLRCSQHRPLRYAFTDSGIPLSQLGFAWKLHTRDGQIYKLAGRFTTSGSVKGTMSVNWYSGRYGTCRTGLLQWPATDS